MYLYVQQNETTGDGGVYENFKTHEPLQYHNWIHIEFQITFYLHLLASTVSFIDRPVLPRLIQYGIYYGGRKTNVGIVTLPNNELSVSVFQTWGIITSPQNFTLKNIMMIIFDGLKPKKKKTNEVAKTLKHQKQIFLTSRQKTSYLWL